jgi:hypothetical protein
VGTLAANPHRQSGVEVVEEEHECANWEEEFLWAAVKLTFVVVVVVGCWCCWWMGWMLLKFPPQSL